MADYVNASINGNVIEAGYSTVSRNFEMSCHDVTTALLRKRADIFEELETQLQRLHAIKWYVAVRVAFTKVVNGEEVRTTPVFHGRTRVLLPNDSIIMQFIEAKGKILESCDKWVRDGSGWTIDVVEMVYLFITKYHPFYGSSFIPTPKKISNSRQGIINIHNHDQKCFLWSVLAAIHGPDRHRHYRVSHLEQYEHTINMEGIKYPVKVSDIKKFQSLNPNISINVFGYEDNETYPLWNTREKGRRHHINLLLLSDNKGNTHYCVITSLSRLLSPLTSHEHVRYYCDYCLHRFSTQDRLNDHLPLCTPHGAQKTRLPTENNKWMKFDNYTLTHKVPFTIYCDFESFVEPIATTINDPTTSHTTNTAVHTPSGFCYLIVNSEGNPVKPPVLYTGPDVVDTLLNMLLDEADLLTPFLNFVKPLNMSAQDRQDFDAATDCHLCHKPLLQDKVINHDHLSGKFLGAAHNTCNLSYKVPKHIPVFFHNLRGYDCHHLMQGFGKIKDKKMTAIAKTSEKYISVSLGPLRFLDSLQFLNASLETLVKNLSSDGPDNFPLLRQCIPHNFDLLIRKGSFPYTWLTDPSKLLQNHLPPRQAFFNDLTQQPLSEDDYAHAQQVWTTFGMNKMQDYHDLYLKTDVLLLADVFENFRSTSLRYYQIDPCHVYSAPGLAWHAMLKMTGVQLELLTDIDKHLFIEKGIRGGVAMIPHRHAKANNPLLPDYDPHSPNSYLIYLDCNNLYGTAMREPLPMSNFRWLAQEEIRNLDVTTMTDDSETGYILEVDLEYPDHLHDLHNDLPLAPEHMTTTQQMLSHYNTRLLRELGMRPAHTQKLISTLSNKTNYVLYHRNLKLYLDLGLRLTKVHKVLSFKQSAWLAPFIDFNTEKRQMARNDFEKDFFKLINNATYGKSMEDVRSRIDFKLVANKKQLAKWVSSPRLMTFFPFNRDLAGLTLKKKTVLLNKPIAVGMTVLEVSKAIMYNFHYQWAVRKYGGNAKLCMTDTDSLFYHVTTPDIYDDIRSDLHLFDTSNYPHDHPCYSVDNTRKPGKFKDEMGGKPPKEIIGLRAKCYSVQGDADQEKKVAKGVPRTAIRTQLRHDLYRRCLFQHDMTVTSALTINSHHHRIFTQNISRLSLCPFDDKRFILDDGIHTLAYGHHRIGELTDSERSPPQPPSPQPTPSPSKRPHTSDVNLTSLLASAPKPKRMKATSSTSILSSLLSASTQRPASSEPEVIDLSLDDD